MNRSRHARRIATLLAVVAAALVAGAATSDAEAQGISPQQLAAQGWTCFVPPAFPDKMSCFNPGLGRPSPESTRPSYSFLLFDVATGTHIGNGHLIRGDLYAGQPCLDGNPYRFIERIGYYECVHE